MTNTPQDKPLPEVIAEVLDTVIWHDQNDDELVYNNRDKAQQALLTAFERSMLEVIGEDEYVDERHHNTPTTCPECKFKYRRNQLRADQRKALQTLITKGTDNNE